MPPTSDQFEDYLGPDESLAGVYSATLSAGSGPGAVTVAVTDHRLVCLGDDGTFVTVGHGSISAVRSRPRTSLDYRGTDYRLLAGGGALLAVLGVAATFLVASGPVTGLVFLTVATVAVTGFLWRRPDHADPVVPPWVVDAVDRAVDGNAARRRYERTVPADVDADDVLLVASALVASAAVAATALLAANPLAFFAPYPVLAGLALVEYAHRHRAEFDGVEVVRRSRREVQITTDGGRELHLWSDPAESIDRDLGELAFVGAERRATPVPAQS